MNAWPLLLAIGAICSLNALLGWRWSRLTENPWAERALGGMFVTPSPDFRPGILSVAELRRRGRRLMIAQPFVFAAGTLVVLLFRP